MNFIGEYLKAARKAKGLSLDDVAKNTRISKKYLDEIEQNITPQLPAAYINAFLKTFAREVDLDLTKIPGVIPTDRALPISLDADNIGLSVSDHPSENPSHVTKKNAAGEQLRQKKRSIVILVLLVVGLVVSIILLREEKLPPPQEVSFSDVVKEQEAKANTMNASEDSLSIFGRKKETIADSLSLEGVASESVWVHIVIDGMKTSELTFPPTKRMKWKAKKNFIVSMGNAEGMIFTLNGKRLGALGTSKKPLRNYIISADNLRKLPAVAN
ncbi:MAG TPA: helix-turn-helix domain-containing protein, partial [Bacteroidota bacterium]|nr:helix-turn-helix domain-containing protein [Bacteroidota bacterium]